MAFFQEPPRLGNQFDEDPLLPSWIARTLGPAAPEIAGELRALGDLAVECYAKQLADRLNEPVLTQWDGWGQRIDRIDVSPLWREATSRGSARTPARTSSRSCTCSGRRSTCTRARSR